MFPRYVDTVVSHVSERYELPTIMTGDKGKIDGSCCVNIRTNIKYVFVGES